MKPTAHPSALRIQQLLAEARVNSDVVEFERPTRTSVEAAAAIGCSVGEIAKSVVFRARSSGQAVVVIASGDNRICEQKVARLVGEELGRANADFVRESTGFVIGGVSPLGHANPVKMLLDADLQRFPMIWAAAGTPFTVFPLTPAELSKLTGAAWSDVRLEE
jgi:prolyl-tRNA editing enzyme YbaK/EbsC (Cys-tRNA(Pro) deacylase)